MHVHACRASFLTVYVVSIIISLRPIALNSLPLTVLVYGILFLSSVQPQLSHGDGMVVYLGKTGMIIACVYKKVSK
jgi:hypothetical protein